MGKNYQSGFSLIEVVIAMMLLAVSFLATLEVNQILLELDKSASRWEEALFLAQTRLEEIKMLAQDKNYYSSGLPQVSQPPHYVGESDPDCNQSNQGCRRPILRKNNGTYEGYFTYHPHSYIGRFTTPAEAQEMAERYKGFFMNTQIENMGNFYAVTVWVFFPTERGEKNVFLATYITPPP